MFLLMDEHSGFPDITTTAMKKKKKPVAKHSLLFKTNTNTGSVHSFKVTVFILIEQQQQRNHSLLLIEKLL